MRACAVVIACSLLLVRVAAAESARPPIRVDVSLIGDGPAESVNELMFRARIRNVTSHPVLIVAATPGVICPTEVLRDGRPVAPQQALVDYLFSHITMRNRSVVELAPGKAIDLKFSGLSCDAGDDTNETLWEDLQPGRYRVRFQYRVVPGVEFPRDTKATPVRERVLAPSVTVRIRGPK